MCDKLRPNRRESSRNAGPSRPKCNGRVILSRLSHQRCPTSIGDCHFEPSKRFDAAARLKDGQLLSYRMNAQPQLPGASPERRPAGHGSSVCWRDPDTLHVIATALMQNVGRPTIDPFDREGHAFPCRRRPSSVSDVILGCDAEHAPQGPRIRGHQHVTWNSPTLCPFARLNAEMALGVDSARTLQSLR